MKHILRTELAKLCLINSKKIPLINDYGVRKRWVGIGWIDEGESDGSETRVVDMSIGIVGCRKRNSPSDYHKTYKALLTLLKLPLETKVSLKDPHLMGIRIVSGGCEEGGDKFAEDLAEELKIPIQIHYPDKTLLDQTLMHVNPRAAYAAINFMRNGLIATDSDILIAVVAPDRKGGTENTITKFCNKFKPELGRNAQKRLIADGKLVLV